MNIIEYMTKISLKLHTYIYAYVWARVHVCVCVCVISNNVVHKYTWKLKQIRL